MPRPSERGSIRVNLIWAYMILVSLGGVSYLLSAISVVNNLCETDQAKSTVTTTAVKSTGATNAVVIVHSNTTIGSVVSDSAGNTWTARTQYTTTGRFVRIFDVVSGFATSATHTFTAAPTFGYPVACVVTFSGGGAFDKENGVAGATATSVQPGSVTPSEDGEILITGLVLNAINTPTIDASFSTPQNVQYSSGNNMGGSSSYLIQGTAGAVNPTWSWSTTSTKATAIATYRPAAAGGATPKRLTTLGAGMAMLGPVPSVQGWLRAWLGMVAP